MHSPHPNPYLPPPLVADDQSPRPTLVRYGVLAFLCSLALLLYVDRVCIGQAATSIRRDLELTDTDMAWVFNAFILAYCIFEVPTGHWGDRFGSRRVITRIVIWWSAFTALTGAAWGLWPWWQRGSCSEPVKPGPFPTRPESLHAGFRRQSAGWHAAQSRPRRSLAVRSRRRSPRFSSTSSAGGGPLRSLAWLASLGRSRFTAGSATNRTSIAALVRRRSPTSASPNSQPATNSMRFPGAASSPAPTSGCWERS